MGTTEAEAIAVRSETAGSAVVPNRIARGLAIASAVSVAAGLLLLAVPTDGAEPPTVTAGAERVTAVDVMVELPKGADPLRAQELEVVLGARPRPVVAVAAPPADPWTGPWRVTVYFEASLSSSESLRQGASRLARFVPTLVALGPVEVVVASPEPATLLPPTRDPALLEDTLAGLALAVESTEELGEVRRRVVVEVGEGEAAGAEPVALAAALAREESSRVQARIDDLALWAAEAGRGGGRQLLLLVGEGFDPDPEEFYRSLLLDAPAPSPRVADPTRQSGSLGRILAGYGWVAFVVAPAEPPPPRRGLRLGKWFFGGIPPLFIGVIHEEERDPDRAEAYLELGRALRRQGKPDEAREAFEKAIHHFAEDPRTSPRKAEAYVELGRLLEAQGQRVAARVAYRAAAELDPDRAGEQAPARVPDPQLLAPWRILVEATAGYLTRSDEELHQALRSLARRWRVTYQVEGWPAGSLESLGIAVTGRRVDLRHPLWGRTSTPAEVAAARLRHLGERFHGEGELAVKAVVEETAPTGGIEVRAQVALWPPAGEEADRERVARVSWGFFGVDLEPEIRHEPAVLVAPGADGVLTLRWTAAPPAGASLLGIVVDELISGRWGETLVDLVETGPAAGASAPRSAVLEWYHARMQRGGAS